jgi:hypothetical protein
VSQENAEKPFLTLNFPRNFFDNITTTTTMRPPRMGLGSLAYPKGRQSMAPVRNAKGNNCSNERYSQYPQNLSTGSVNTNETKSSYDESIDKSMTDKSDSTDVSLKTNDQENSEPEPEWFSWPVSRTDVIELQGFDDEEETNLKSEVSERPSSRDGSNRIAFDEFVRQQRQTEVASSAYRRSSYNQPTRYPRNYNMPGGSNSYNNNTRYRNPLHQSTGELKLEMIGRSSSSERIPDTSSSSFNSSFNRSGSDMLNYSYSSQEASINPFFDAWKRQNDWAKASHMMTIADVENALKMKQMQQQQVYGLPYGGNPAVPQFFQNAGTLNQHSHRQMSGMNSPFGFDNIQQPTPEQLQQHTQEIMRNAILRKQFQGGKFN